MKLIKNILIILLVLFIINPLKINAEPIKSPLIGIGESKSIKVGDVDFNTLSFKDYSNTSTMAFGVVGKITNNSDSIIEYTVNVYYYDVNRNYVCQNTHTVTANKGTSDFNVMSSLRILNGHSVSEIKYYELLIEEKSRKIDNSKPKISSLSNYKSYPYIIDEYDVNMVVNKDNSFDITETISVYFNESRHGIYRSLPLRNNIVRLDGSNTSNRAKITNVSVNDKFTSSREGNNLKIKIGSSLNTIRGEKKYIIKYNYNLGKDKMKNYDELYFNIIGTEWDTVIGNVSFRISMPKDFDTSKLGFSKGIYGSVDNADIKYTVDDNQIIGSYDGVLQSGEGLTVRCELEEGYFSEAVNTMENIVYLIFIVPIVGLLLSFCFWYQYGKDDQVIETVEFYPPEGRNSLEIGMLYKGKADRKDVTSLLIYLANKGYIKIKETENQGLFSTYKDFEITKLREYDGNDENERLFLKGLFSVTKTVDFNKVWEIKKEAKARGEKISYNDAYKLYLETVPDITSVTSSDLYNHFYKTMEEILKKINSKENNKKIFETGRTKFSVIVIILIILSLIAIIGIPVTDNMGIEQSILSIGLIVFYSPFFISAIVSKTNILSKLFILGFITIHFFIMSSGFNLFSSFSDPTYLTGLIVGGFCIIGMILFLKYMSKRTQYGNEILGKIKGFKNFLETAEKEKLEALVMENPRYFYDILPYTYVLDVSDKWIKKFETISLEEPSWYDSPNGFNVVTFGSFMDSTMSSAERSMSSSPSDSGGSGGGSSGGGSSGGGSGGGGGGSW